MAIEQNTQTDPYAEIRDLIRQGETGDANTNPYDSWYGHVPSATPDKPISSMTLDEVYAYQDKLVNATQGLVTYKGQKVGTSAVGQSQFLKSTLQDYAKKLNLPGSTIFSPDIQDRLTDRLIDDSGGADWKAGKIDAPIFADRMAGVWSSFAKSDGKTAYAEQSRVGVPVERFYQSLSNIAKGVPYNPPRIQQTVETPASVVAPVAPVSKVEEIVRPAGLIQQDGKWYNPKEGPSDIYATGFKKGTADFNFDSAISELSKSDNPHDQMMLHKIQKVKEEMAGKSKIDLSLEGTNINWKWQDQSQRDKRWSGVSEEDKHGPFGGKKTLGASGSNYEDALDYMIQHNHLTYDKAGSVADLSKEYVAPKPAEVKPTVVPVTTAPIVAPVVDSPTKVVTPVVPVTQETPTPYSTHKASDELAAKNKKDVLKTVAAKLEEEKSMVPPGEDPEVTYKLQEMRERLKGLSNIKMQKDPDNQFRFIPIPSPVDKHFLGGLIKGLLPMVKSALPSVVGALGGSDQLGSVVSDAVGSAITPTVPAPESIATIPADTMSDESLLKLAQKLKVLMGTTPGVVPTIQPTEKLQWGGSVLLNAINSVKKVRSDIDNITDSTNQNYHPSSDVQNLPNSGIIPQNVNSVSVSSTPDFNKFGVKQTGVPVVPAKISGLEKFADGIDLNAITKFAFSKPVRSNPVHMNVAPYRPMVIRNPETGMQTEQQRIAEQDLANQMQVETSSNPDDVRTSIAKAKSMADYRAKIESDKAQNKIATQGAYTNSVNQDNAQRSAYEQRAEQIDYSNKSADEQANMQYNLLEQRRQGQLAADMLAGVGSVKSAERNMDYQVAHATYQTGMRDADTKAILARNVLSNATYDLNAVSDNKSSAAYAKAYAVYTDADAKNTIAQTEYAAKDKELRATFMGVQRGLSLQQALPGSVGSLTFKAGGTIEKAQIKATADIEKAELKKATDDNKLSERRAIVAYKVFKDATDLVKKSNEVLVKAYFRR